MRRERLRACALWTLALVLIATGAAAFVEVTDRPPAIGDGLPWWAVAGILVAASSFRLDIAIGRHDRSLSALEVATVVALLTARPHDLLAGAALAAVVSHAVLHRTGSVRAAVNVGVAMAHAALALGLFDAVTAKWSGEVAAYAGAVGAAIAANLFSGLVVSVALWISGKAGTLREVLDALIVGTLMSVVPAVVGAQLVALAGVSAWWIPVGLVPLALAWIVDRLYLSLRRENRRNEFLYRASLALHGSDDLESAFAGLLAQVREGLRATSARIVVVDADGRASTLVSQLGFDDGPRFMPASETVVGLLRLVTARPGARLVDPMLAGELAVGRGPALVAPIEGDVSGALVVGGRLGERAQFDDDDVELAAIVASQVAVALDHNNVSATLARLQELEEELTYRAGHDELTGLANRRLFHAALDHLAETDMALDPDDPARYGAVVVIDLDDFKRANDTLGHVGADVLLAELGRRLKESSRSRDVVARIGGDEFAIVVDGMLTVGDLRERCERARRAFDQPFDVDGVAYHQYASIGAALRPVAADRRSDVVSDADVAMFEAKRRGKNQALVYEPWMSEAEDLRRELAVDAGEAIASGRFTLAYQPIVSLVDGSITGVEALVRWDHPTRGLLIPDSFLDVVDEAGLADQLTAWVVEQAAADVAALQPWAPSLLLHVNVSNAHLDRGLAELLADRLHVHGLAPGRLVVEIRETALDDRDATTAALEAFAGAGFLLALDDYGVGASSLAHLVALPLSMVKFDRTFVAGIVGDERRATLVSAMARLAEQLGLTVMGEGIERDDQAGALRRAGCVLGQGYRFAPPMSVDKLRALVVEGRSGHAAA